MSTKIVENIRKLREEKGISQGKMAALLGMSRPTYASMEAGRRDVTSEELEKVKNLLGVSWGEIVNPVAEAGIRSDEKFAQMYMYVLKKYFRESGVPKTKLAKILYLADFTAFYERQEPISGVTYIRRDYGPVADVFFTMTDELYDEAKIDIKPLDSALMIEVVATAGDEFGLLSPEEREIIDKVCREWRDRRTKEIVDFTHSQKPWKACRDKEEIPYSLIIQEDPNHVYTPYTN